jgi:predicted ATPase
MIRDLNIKRFKAWEDSGTIRLAPLTIFCGNNSSGKSSIAQFLLMLKQTVESSDRQSVLFLGDKGSTVDLGTFSDIIHRHDTKQNLSFGFTFDTNTIKFTDLKTSREYGPFKHLRFNAVISQQESTQRIIVEQCNYELLNGSTVQFSLVNSNGKYKLNSANYPLIKRQMRVWSLPHPENFFGFPDEAVAYYQNTGFLSDLSLSIKSLFKSIYYVGPLRNNPQRQYQFAGDVPQDVGVNGEKAINALLAAVEMGRSISPGFKKRADRFDHLVARWLKDMQLIDSFRVVPIADGRKEYEVKLKIQKDSSEVLITDVGFGISQVLPVIVQCFYTPANSTLFFEQPEIHLHPSVQSHLGDVFIEAIHSREKGVDRNTQIIVESHSEHLIRRIQRRVAENRLKVEEVAIYFIRQDNGKSKIEELKMDLFGNIINWPDNFFGSDLEDLSAMTDAAFERRKK